MDDIIYIEVHQQHFHSFLLLDIQSWLIYTSSESLQAKMFIYFVVLDSRSLVKPIQSFIQLVYKVFLTGDAKSLQLFNIDMLLQFVIEKGRLHIQLVHRQLPLHRCCQEYTHCLHSHNKCEHYSEVYPLFLDVSFWHQSRLPLEHTTVRVVFGSVNPFDPNHLFPLW